MYIVRPYISFHLFDPVVFNLFFIFINNVSTRTNYNIKNSYLRRSFTFVYRIVSLFVAIFQIVPTKKIQFKQFISFTQKHKHEILVKKIILKNVFQFFSIT